MESLWWKFKIYGAWLAAVVAALLGYLHGFALLLVGFGGALRRSELVALNPS
jgi:hypothetical protein